jgi:hypothetical protein
MKKLLVLVAVISVVGGTLGSASARSDKKKPTRAVCHRTSSKSKPYVRVRVTAAQLRAHLKHTADIYPAPAACPRTLLATTGGGTAFTVTLTGETESPAGDPVGTGTATIRARRGQAQVCFTFDVKNITLPSAGAHMHQGAAGASGGIVVPLAAPGAAGTSRGCVAASRYVLCVLLCKSL